MVPCFSCSSQCFIVPSYWNGLKPSEVPWFCHLKWKWLILLQKIDFRWYSPSLCKNYVVSSFSMWFPVFLIPLHWNDQYQLPSQAPGTGSFSMIVSFKLRMIIWLKKIDSTLFLYVVPCVFWFHCIEKASIPSQVPFAWFGSLNWK